MEFTKSSNRLFENGYSMRSNFNRKINMTTKNLNNYLLDIYQTLFLNESVSRAEIFDKLYGLSQLITVILKDSGVDNSMLVIFFDLEKDVENGMPIDSPAILAYTLTANICTTLFREKDEVDAINSERFEEMIAEYEEGIIRRITH